MTTAPDPLLRTLIETIISRYHTTRLGSDFVPHILAGNQVQQAIKALDAPRAPMSDDEILQRARRAVADTCNGSGLPWSDKERADILNGTHRTYDMNAVMQALRDLDKPLVGPVVLACREIVAKRYEDDQQPVQARYARNGDLDGGKEMNHTIAAYRAGRESAA